MSRKFVAFLVCLALFSAGAFGEVNFPLETGRTLTAWTVNTVSHYCITDNYVINWILEKTNVTIDVTHEFTGEDAVDRLTYAMASEPLPDILLSTGWTKAECALYSSQGYVIALDELLEDCENWNALESECKNDHATDLMMPDGHIYCYGTVNECFHLTHQARMWVYKPWIDSLCDGKLPETTEEFRDYLRKVAASDPNGNGLQDEIPLTGEIYSGFATDPFTFISNAFVHNNCIYGSTNQIVAPGVYLEGNTVHCNWTEDGYREALIYMHELFEEGLLYGQTYTQNWYQLSKLVQSVPNVVGAFASGRVPSDSNEQLEDGSWDGWVCLPPLKGPDGIQLSYQSVYDYFGQCNGLITRACSDPQLAIQVFDLLAGAEGTLVQNYGQMDVNWTWCEEGEGAGINGEPALYRVNIENYSLAADDTDKIWPTDAQICSLTEKMRTGFLVEKDVVNGEQFLWQCAELYDIYSPGTDTVYPDIAYTPEQSLKLLQYENTVGTYVKETAISFITGSLDPAREWDTYLANLDNMDQEGYLSLLQEAYDDWNANR